jgi:hypothetical protein
MFIAYAVVAVLLSVALAASGRAKLVGDERVVTGLTGVGVPLGWFPWLAGCEIAGAFGLLAGMIYRPLGIAAATGVVLYFVGAVVTHVRAGDVKGLTAPAGILMVAVAALALAGLSA